MKNSDLRSNLVGFTIYLFAIISAIGFIIPATSYFVDGMDMFWEDNIGIEQKATVGLGIIMIATTGGIGMAFVIKRRSQFMYFKSVYCIKSGDKLYEDEQQEHLFCPTHGEILQDKYGYYENNGHFAWKDGDRQTMTEFLFEQRTKKTNTKAGLEEKISELELKLDRLSDDLDRPKKTKLPKGFEDLER